MSGMTYAKGSQGEAVALALVDETFRTRALAFARVRESLFRELSRAETGVGRVRCVSTSRLGGSSRHPGYLSAVYDLTEFVVSLDFLGGDEALRADLSAFRSRVRVFDNGVAHHVEAVEDGGWGCDDVCRLWFSWRARNPLFWKALALVRETSHPLLCGVCLGARIDDRGKTCGCEAAAEDVTMSLSTGR